MGKRLRDIAENISSAFNATCTVEIKKGSATVVNDKVMSDLVKTSVEEVLGQDMVKSQFSSALMGSDDFANYSSIIPGVYFFLYTNNEEKGITASNHNSKFNVDEDVLWEGVAAYTAIALKYLS